MSTGKDRLALQRGRELRRHEATIEAAQKSFVELGRALGKIRAEQLYAVAGCQTFEEYVEERWDIGRAHAYRLINAARVALSLSPMGYKIDSERVARELAAAPDDEARALLAEEATRRADGRRLTAALVAATREEMFPDATVIDGDVVEDERPAIAPAPDDLTNAFTQAIEDVAAHTSGAVPPASTEDASLALGEPDVDEQAASTSGTQDSPAADPLSDSSSHAGVPAAGGQTEERDEEKSGPWDVVWTSVGNGAEIDRQTFDSYQLALAEMERSRRAGSIAEVDVEPTPTDSPTGLEAAQPRDGRSETDHHDGAGVSLSGEALPVESRPAGALLEDGGTAQDPPSSSDPVVIRASVEDMIGTVERLEVPREEWDSWTPAQRRAHIDNFGAEVMNNCGGYGAGIESGAPASDLEDEPLAEPTPTDRLLASVDALINLVDELDVEAVASMLFPAELENLHQHSEALAAFVAKVSRIRFEALTRTP